MGLCFSIIAQTVIIGGHWEGGKDARYETKNFL